MRSLIANNVDVVVAQTKQAIVIARQATSTVPIVMGALNGDPVAEGFAKDLRHPGGNITGSYYNIAAGGDERVAILVDLVPSMKHIGIELNPESEPSLALAGNLAVAARKRDLQVLMMEVRNADAVDSAFAAAKTHGVQGVVTVTGAEMFAIRRELVEAQNKYHIPTVTGSIGYAEMGGLAKLGPDVPGLWRKMAPIIDQLLNRTAQAGDIPLLTLNRFELDLNLRAAQELGLNVSETLQSCAKRIFR